MKQNEIIKGLHVRVSRHTTDAKGAETRFINVWPVKEEARARFIAINVADIQFDGDPAVFTVGSEVKGDAVIAKIEDCKANETDADGVKTGKLVDRVKLAIDGSAIEDENGNVIILQRITLRWASKIQLARAKKSEELVETVESIS